MANRILRDWTQSETVDLLTDGAERFFVRLIMKADDFGCYYANPKLLKAALFPLKDFSFDQVDKWKKECVKAGLVKSYTVYGKEYLQIKDFGQRLRSMTSKFPQPDSDPRTIDSDPRLEEKRNEVEEKVKTARKFSDDFYQSKEQAFEEIKTEDLYLDECHRLITGKGWRVATKVNVMQIFKVFLLGKADLSNEKSDVKKHFKNWLIREKLDTLTKICNEG